MPRGLVRLIAATLLAAAPAAANAAPNLVTNGGFEASDTVPTGWTASGDPSASVVTFGHSGFNSYAFFGLSTFGPSPGSVLSQNIATGIGGDYLVDFFLLNSGGGSPDRFTLSFGTQSITLSNTDAPADWTEFSFLVRASDTSTLLQAIAFNDPGIFQLDDVSVTAVVEPATLTLMAVGLGLVGFRRRSGRTISV